MATRGTVELNRESRSTNRMDVCKQFLRSADEAFQKERFTFGRPARDPQSEQAETGRDLEEQREKSVWQVEQVAERCFWRLPTEGRKSGCDVHKHQRSVDAEHQLHTPPGQE